jgi:four helix bundle protein
MDEMEKEIIFNRAKELCLRVIRMSGHLPDTFVSEFIIEQLIRSSAYMGIHYKDTCGTGSIAESTEKLVLAIEKANDVLFWLEIIEGCEMVKADRLVGLKQETEELISAFKKGLKISSGSKSRKKV